MRLTRRQAIAVAITCGVLAALLSYAYLRRASTSRPPAQPATVTVVYSRASAEPGVRVTPAMLGTRSVPADQAPADAIRSPGEVDGWVVVTPISAGDILTRSNVRQPSSALGLRFLVPEGMRAVTVALDQVSGVAGLAKPGDHVDVIATFDLPGSEMTVSRIVLQDVEVLAVGSQIVPTEAEQAEAPPAEGTAAQPRQQAKIEPTATLAVTPEEAEKLVLADTEGKIRLALRRAGDRGFVQVPPVVNWNLIGYRPPSEKGPAVQPAAEQPVAGQPRGWYPPPTTPSPATAGSPPQSAQPPPRPPAPAPQQPSVEVFRGTEREVIVP